MRESSLSASSCCTLFDASGAARRRRATKQTPTPSTTTTDDADWSYVTKEGDEYGCDHVAKKPEKRCGRVGNGGVVASEACPKTCGTC